MHPQFTPKALARFWAKVDKNGPAPAHRPTLGPCWMWTASCDGSGYPQVSRLGHLLGAHRVSYELTFGSIPDGLLVLHQCDTPRCVRPDQLFVGTHVDNMRDMVNKGRSVWSTRHVDKFPRGSKHWNARLTEVQVREIRTLASQGETHLATLAARYGVSTKAIWSVITRRHWKRIV